MALQSVPVPATDPGFDINEAHAAIEKARGIVEMISEACMHKFEYDAALRFTGALWAVTDQLDKLAAMTGLDPEEVANG